MKKYLKTLSVLFIALIALTGCGGGNKKTLTCSMKASESGMEMNYQLKFQYNEEKIKKVNIDVEVEVDKELAGSMSVLKTSLDNLLKQQFEQYLDATVDSEVSGNKYKFSLESKSFPEEEQKSYDEAKTLLESNGYECK